jgi:hypothetical protein
MSWVLSSLPFFTLLSTGNYYVKNIYPLRESDLAHKMSESAAEQMFFALSMCMLHIYID